MADMVIMPFGILQTTNALYRRLFYKFYINVMKNKVLQEVIRGGEKSYEEKI